MTVNKYTLKGVNNMRGYWNEMLIKSGDWDKRMKFDKQFKSDKLVKNMPFYSNGYLTFASNFLYYSSELYGYIKIDHGILKPDELKKLGIDKKLELSLKNYMLVNNRLSPPEIKYVEFKQVKLAFNELKDMLEALKIERFFYGDYLYGLSQYLYFIEKYHIKEYELCNDK